ncbi:MAG: hydrogenase formation protein HypD [Peptococcaceae bacterium]
MLQLKMSKDTVQSLLKKIEIPGRIRLMEVCGTHTVAIARAGLKQLLPPNIELISGPGCPVCVTDQQDIEKILLLAQNPAVIITTFGDMLRVPGSTGSLQEMQAQGADIRMIYSPLDAVNIARNNPDKEIVFIGVGFETTAPTVALAVEEAVGSKLANFSVVCLHKLVIPALQSLLLDQETKVDGFLLPGHVSSIIGTVPYEFIPREYQKGCVVAGFEPGDILESIYLLTRQLKKQEYKVDNQYRRGVKAAGNMIARELINKYFTPAQALWRGLGLIAASGLELRPEFQGLDALKRFELEDVAVKVAPSGCICGQILKGKQYPQDCGLFKNICTPGSPVGPCMVSSEGACAASFYYSGGEMIGR